ncbi:glycosyltransferase, partial [Bacillus cereus]|nr:glycosyltransferase [Bacillus cereus]
GYVSDEELPLYHQASNLFVVPTQALEGFGLITVEAMASGLPVLATPVGGNKEILRGFRPELLFKGTDSEAIAEGLLHVLDHRELL